MINYRSERDRFNNDVTLITLPCGQIFRLVHHTSAHVSTQRGTIFRRKGIYIRMRYVIPDDPCKATVFEIGGYKLQYGDGEVLDIQCEEGWPEIKESDLQHEDLGAALMLILQKIKGPDCNHLWLRKEAA